MSLGDLGEVKGWCVEERPAVPPWPGSAADVEVVVKSGKSVIQTGAKGVEGLSRFCFMPSLRR